MKNIIGIIAYIVLGVATFFVAHLITSIIGYDGMIVYIVAFAIVLAAFFLIARKEKSNKEKKLIKYWSQSGYKGAIAVLNSILPEEYCIDSSEEGLFERIFNDSINEAKQQHFDNNAEDSDYELLKNNNSWLVVTMATYCAYRCSWEDMRNDRIQMLNYVGEYSEPSLYSDETRYFDKYEYTASGIVAEKIMLATALLTNGDVARFKNNIDNGWVRVEKNQPNDQ